MAQQPAGFIPDGFVPDPTGPPTGFRPHTLWERLTGTTTAEPADVTAQREAMLARMQGQAPPDLGGSVLVENARTAATQAPLIGGLLGGAVAGPIGGAVGGGLGTALNLAVNPAERSETLLGNVGQLATDAALSAAPFAVGRGVKAAAPVVRAVIPSSTRAAANFERVMAATRNVPINVNDPGSVALRIQQLAERGGSMPKVARDFLRRVTEPGRAPMVYEEARDFYHNISRLSADEYKRLTPVMRREIGNLRAALNRSLEGAARQTGTLAEYRSAMKEYARRARIEDLASDVWQDVKRWAVPGTVVAYGLNKLSDLVRD